MVIDPTAVTYVMRTLDRTPRKNYLSETLWALEDSHDQRDPREKPEFHVIDSGGGRPGWHEVAFVEALVDDGMGVTFHPAPDNARLTNNQNALRALLIALAPGTDWIVHLEDDLDVCRDLDGSIRRWLGDHARDDRRLYTFHTPYAQVRQRAVKGLSSWDYPIKNFYGNQCWAIRRADALSLAAFLERRIPTWSSGQGFDLLIKQWTAETYPQIDHFLASCPSFVQHIGEESALHFPRFHQNSSFPGREWTYVGRLA